MRKLLSHPELDEQYKVSSRRQILSLLSQLMEENIEVSILLKELGEAIPTSILRLENDVVLLKATEDQDLNTAISESDEVTLAANVGAALIKFTTPKLQQASLSPNSGFIVDVPGSLARIQRRESFRISLPPPSPVRCKISFTSADGNFNLVWMEVVNISTGGIGMIDRHRTLPPQLNIIYEDCQLELIPNKKIPVKLKIRSHRREEQKNGATIHFFGCQFLDITGSASSSIQRFLLRLERDRNAHDIPGCGVGRN